jgi:hypothetical protein
MLSFDCRKASALIVQQLAPVGAPHAALLFAHDQLGSALQLQYATALDARARQLRRVPVGDAQGDEQTEASCDQSLLVYCLPDEQMLCCPPSWTYDVTQFMMCAGCRCRATGVASG